MEVPPSRTFGVDGTHEAVRQVRKHMVDHSRLLVKISTEQHQSSSPNARGISTNG